MALAAGNTAGETTLERALRLYDLGLCVIPLKPGSKEPDFAALPNGWKEYQRQRPSAADLPRLFGQRHDGNVGIPLGIVSNVVVIETDSQDAEDWAAVNLPKTPMMTASRRGVHRYYRLPTGPNATVDIPATIAVGNLKIEVKRGGQYVVAPRSVHPTGHVYYEVEPWPKTLAGVPEFPVAVVLASLKYETAAEGRQLPPTVGEGSRNTLLFREGCRLRRLSWSVKEIATTLAIINLSRCHPALEAHEVETIAQSCARYEPAVDTFPATETGDAEFFAECNADTVRYDHRRGRWMVFDGTIWVPQASGQIGRLAIDTVRARQRAAVGDKDRMRWAIGGEARKRQTNLLALAQNINPIADAGDCWDLDPWLLGAENGIVDLRTGTLRPGCPGDRITMRVRTVFDPSACCPVWDQTVGEIFQSNADLVGYFDRYVGYSLTGDCREESLAFCCGDGANGKGTLMNTLGRLLGDYADDLPFSAFELQSRAGIPNDIAKIVNRRFITASETGETQRLNEARVKALTGRDPITARFLHKEFFTFQPVAKFWLATNHKPDVRDDSEGFWRRLHLIPFEASFVGREDKTLKDRLRGELPGILARAVRGCLAWQREGLNPPEIVRAATKAYRADSSPLARFTEECCVLREGARTTFGELFKAYVKWCGANSRDGRMGKHEFSTSLRQRFKVDERNSQRVTFLDISLLDLFREGEQ